MLRDLLTNEEAKTYLAVYFKDDLESWFSIDRSGWQGCGFIGNLTGRGNPNRPYNRIIVDARRSHVFAAAFRAMLEIMRSINEEKGLAGVTEVCRQNGWPMCSAGLAGLDDLSVFDMVKQAELIPENDNNIQFYEQAVKLFSSLMQTDERVMTTNTKSGAIEIEMQEKDGLMLVNLAEGLFFVDTGSPTSFTRDAKIRFGGKVVSVFEFVKWNGHFWVGDVFIEHVKSRTLY